MPAALVPAVALALLLAGAGAAKLLDPVMTVGALRAMHLPASPLVVRIGAGAELAIGILALTAGGPVPYGLAAASFVGFAVFVAAAMRRGTMVGSCGCFGREDTPPHWLHVVLDLALAAVAVAAMGFHDPPVELLADDLGDGIVVVVLSLLTTWLVYAAFVDLPRVLAEVRAASTAPTRAPADVTTPVLAATAADLPALAAWLAAEGELIVVDDPMELAGLTDGALARRVLLWTAPPAPLPDQARHELARAQALCPFVVVAATEGERTSGGRWTRSDFVEALIGAGVDTTLLGHVRGVGAGDGPHLVVIGGAHGARPRSSVGFRAAVVLKVRNEVDILPEVLDHLIAEGLEVHVLENWSTDGTWELLSDARDRGVVRELMRFPAGGPDDHFDSAGQVRVIESYVTGLDVDWVMVCDGDEIRCSPWPGVRLLDTFAHLDGAGYSAAAFTVIDFRYLEDASEPTPPFERSMDHFEFGTRPGHFLQVRAWKNAGPVDLASTGGHSADFAGRRTFPLKLLLKHYPLRGYAHAHRKVFEERLPRSARERETHGWHHQYDAFEESGHVPAWSASDLERWDEARFLDHRLVERLTGIGLTARSAGESSVDRLGEGVAYQDGAEPALLEILRQADDVSSGSDELATHIVDWPTRYHLSPQRVNLLKPLELCAGLRVLDVGAGTGSLARYLGEQGCQVTALEGNLLRAEVAAERCRDLSNVRVVCGTIDDLDADARFDLVCIIGVLEYTSAEIGGAAGPAHLLAAGAARLEEGGALALAIENQLGLKYLMGGAEDHRGKAWTGIEDYPGPPGARTWTRQELASMLEAAGLRHQTWMASYPDYKLPSVIVSEQTFHREDAPELLSQLVLRPVAFLDLPPTRLGDAAAAHAVALRAGIGLEVASSYLVVATKEPGGAPWVSDDVLAWILAGHRVRAFRRDRVLTRAGELQVVGGSEPTSVGWLEHHPGERRTFVPGTTLGTELDAAVRAHDRARMGAVLDRWSTELRSRAAPAGPETAAAGPYGARPGRLALPPEYLDASPSNFVRAPEGLVLIDDEWRVPGGVDLELVLIRALWIVAHGIVTSGIAHPWDVSDSVDVVFRDLLEAIGLAPAPDRLSGFVEAEVELQLLVAASDEHHLRGDWLNPSRDGIEGRPDEVARVRLEETERERAELAQELEVIEAERREVAGQRDHYVGVVAGQERDLQRMRTLHGWVLMRAARSRLGRRLRDR